jgi:hypothetical protein
MTAEHPRLEWHLENWARYQRTRHDFQELDCKTTPWWAGNYDTDRATDQADITQAEELDAIIWSTGTPECLNEVERASLVHIHIGAVFRFRRVNLQDVYQQAREKLSAMMIKRRMT